MTQFPTGLDMVGIAPGLNVFSVTSAQLNAATFIKIKVPQGATILVNVSGAAIDMNQGSLGTVSIWDPVTRQYIVDNHFINGLPVPSTAWLTLRQSLLWNFSTATSILKNSVSWPGTILAPLAHFQFGQGSVGPGHIDGSLIANSVDGVVGAETHDMAFVGGCLPEAPSPTPTGSIGIIKQITGPPPDADVMFEFAVDCGSEGGTHDVAVQVPPGQSSGQASVGNLPVGTVCTITETTAPPGYDSISVTPNPVTVPATEDPPVTVTATDNHQLGELQLVKTLDRPAPVAGSVTLHVSCTDGTDQDVELTVTAGSASAETVIGGIAVGAVCTVTETAAPADWQEVSISPASVTILPDGNPPVTVTAADTVRLGALQLIKQTNLAVTTDTSFTLHVDCDGTAFDTDVTITVPAGASSADASPITGIPFGTTCTVSEPAPPAGWKLQSIEPESVVIGADGTSTVTVTAHNASIRIVEEPGSLQLVKQLTGPSDGVAHSFTLHVVCTDGFTTDATLTVPAGDTAASVTLTGLTPGASCTVSEPAPTPGFTLTSISPNPVVIAPGDQPSVVVTATNDRQLGSIGIIKQITGPPPDADVMFEFAVDCGSEGGTHDVAVQVPPGQSSGQASVGNLPVGTVCTITETSTPPGYDSISVTPNPVTVPATEDPPVTVTATDNHQLGELQLVKTLDRPAPVAGSVTLHVSCTDGTDQDVELTVTAGSASAETVIGGIAVGAVCTVTETAAPADWQEVSISPASVTILPDGNPPVTVTAADTVRLGALQLIKQTNLAVTTDTSFTLHVDCDGTAFDTDVTITVPAGASSADASPITGIPFGTTCTVSEPAPPAGWKLQSIEPESVVIGADGRVHRHRHRSQRVHQNRRGTGQPAAGQATDRTQRRRRALVYVARRLHRRVHDRRHADCSGR